MHRKLAILSLGAAVLALGCNDVVQPTAHGASGAQVTSSLLTLIQPVQRSAALTQDVTWSFAAGPNGAASSDEASGLAVVIPAGALADTITITITALAGSNIAYRFEPHGLQFARNVSLTQDLTKTTVSLFSGLALSGAYFSTDTLELTSSGLAIVSEVIGALGNPLTHTATFPIRHFSGYILASGRSDSTSTGGAQ